MKNLKAIWLATKDYLIIIVVVLLIRTFLVTPALVQGSSMNDLLQDKDFVIINKLYMYTNELKRFDIVVINNKKDGDRIIKRVIGLPGEKIEYKNDTLYINDKLVKTDKYNFKYTSDFLITLKEDEYYCLGDNRPISKDSRYLGPFSKKDILGKVSIRLFPFNKIGRVD